MNLLQQRKQSGRIEARKQAEKACMEALQAKEEAVRKAEEAARASEEIDIETRRS